VYAGTELRLPARVSAGELFDAEAVSFVSVTQQFNTTSSMGRLTLNVLLSFAQFEREVTGERIRDKIAASKKKGMWMGGLPSLGYDVKDRKLVVNESGRLPTPGGDLSHAPATAHDPTAETEPT
jgi:site-specific DNA recombinase